MAEKVLFKVIKPPAGCRCQFSGRKEVHENQEFNEKDYQVALMFEETTEGIVDQNNCITGFKQHPFKVWKYVDLDTPFFKECVIKRYTIQEMSFHFFHSDGQESFQVNFFSILLKDVKILQSRIHHFDISPPHIPDKKLINPNAQRPYIEELVLTASDITWKYKRDTQPRKASKSTQMRIGTAANDT